MPEIDYTAMATAEGISVAAIKAALGVEPSNAVEARENLLFLISGDASSDRKITTAIKTWVQFVSTPAEARVLCEYLLPKKANHEKEYEASVLLWKKLSSRAVRAAKTFEAAKDAFISSPGDGDERKQAAMAMLRHCKATGDFPLMWKLASAYIENQELFCNKWAEAAAGYVEELRSAYEMTKGTVKPILLEWIQVCPTVAEIRTLYREGQYNKELGAQRGKILERWLELAEDLQDLRALKELCPDRTPLRAKLLQKIAKFYEKSEEVPSEE